MFAAEETESTEFFIVKPLGSLWLFRNFFILLFVQIMFNDHTVQLQNTDSLPELFNL